MLDSRDKLGDKGAMKRTRLTREIIIEESIRLLGEEGMDGVNLRTLAHRLAVRAPSLYWHFPDKATLLAEVKCQLFQRALESVPHTTDWRSWMRHFGAAIWKSLDSVRDSGRLISTTTLTQEQYERLIALARARISTLNIPLEEGIRLQWSIQVLLYGWSIYAHAPSSSVMARTLKFRSRAMQDVETLISGAAARIHSRTTAGADEAKLRRRQSRARPPKT